jgi:hypothetical protein
MGKYDSGRATDLGGINIEARRPDSINGIRFDSDRDDPSSANDVILYRGTGGVLKFWDGSSATTLGSAGALVSYTLNDAYDDGVVLTVDNGAVVMNGVAQATAVLSLTGDAGTTAPILLFTNAGSGNDITGTSSLWSVAATGAAIFLSVATDTISSAGATDLTLETNAGTNSSKIVITDAANGAITAAMNGTGKFVISGTTETNVGFQLTNGDAAISDGSLTIIDDDNAATVTITTTGNSNCLTIVADSVATGNVIDVNADGVTSGALIHLDSSAAGMVGSFIDCYNGAGSVFTIGVDGATVIAGTASGSNVLTLTLGDLKLSGGAQFITQTANAAALTIVADATVGNIVIDVNADGVTTGTLLHLDTSAAGFAGKYIQCYDGAADDFSVGVDGATIITTSAAGTIGLTITHAGTTGDAMQIAATALTTGDALQIASTGVTIAAGELLKITNTENGNATATPKTGNVASITSSVTQTTASATFDYDNLLVSRSDISNNAGFTLTSTGSTLKVLHTATQTAGTLADSSVGLEIEQVGATGYTGNVVQVTGVAVGARAIDVISAATSVSDVRITGSGVKASTKGVLEVTSSGATAAGGAVLRVSASGVPAAATSYLAVFTNAAATVAANPVCVYINGKDSTAASLQVTGSGAMAGGLVELMSTAAGALGAVLKFDQTANSAANSDVIGRILFTAQDDANAAETYARIDVVIRDTAAAGPDASIVFYADKAGTNTQLMEIGWDSVGAATLNGILVGDNAASAYVSSLGNFDLILKTGNATTGNITLTDGANGAITLTPNGSGKVDIAGPALMSKTESIGAGTGGAIDVVSSISELATDVGGDAFQLADGTEGQLKFIILKTDGGGDAVITPANPGGYATITMADAGDSVTLLFTNSKWYVAGSGGVGAGAVIA